MISKIEVTIGDNSPAVFVGEIMFDGRGDDGERELQMRGRWEGLTQTLTIIFTQPTCSWKYLEV